MRTTRKRVSHGLDALGVCTVQLAHEVENARQALLINRDLRLIQLQSRELRDVLDVGASEGHGVICVSGLVKQCEI